MKLYLLRHAEPMSKDQDPEQHLSDKGRAQAASIAMALPDGLECRILHSGKARAAETAAIIGRRFGIEPQPGDSLAPMDDPNIWAERLEHGGDCIMLVGHLPYLSRLVSVLVKSEVDGAPVDFEPATAVCLSPDGDGWRIEETLRA